MEKETLLLDKRTETLVREYVPEKHMLDSLADFFSALSDSTRIKIVSALSISPMCVNDISSILGINQTTVSHQLKNLKNIGVVEVLRQGKIAFYSIKDKAVLDIMLSAVNFL